MIKMPEYLRTILSEGNWDILCNQIDKKIKENGKVMGRDLIQEEYGLGEIDEMFKDMDSCVMSNVLSESENTPKKQYVGFVLSTLISLNYLRIVFRLDGKVVFPEELGNLTRGYFENNCPQENLDKMGRIVWGFEYVEPWVF